jgi:N-ethylmaleimide reductase
MNTKTEQVLTDALFQPIRLGDLTLSNRIVMAPLTRSRAVEGNIPGPLAAEYYAQRATVGLIIAEATQVSDTAQGYADTPGLHTPAQVAGWKKVTDAVHKRGGRIFVQLWHTGRMSHVAFQPGGQAPLAPSAISANGKTYIDTQTGFVETSTPRALEASEIPGVIEDFRTASANAIEAGFDGVEIHGAHGYLVDAFLRDGSNQRTDSYGGSIENRARFLLEIMQTVTNEIGASRTGIRLSPVSPVNGSSESNPQPLFEYVVRELEKLQPAFIHVVEGHTGGPRDNAPFDYQALRQLYSGIWIVNNGYTKEMAIEAISSGRADMVSFGRPMISNPDLVRRLREDAPLNRIVKDVPIYGGSDPHGYTDYPTLTE